MNVVEKDNLVHGMLNEEFERCKGMIISLKQSLYDIPKGSIQVRQKKYKDNVYSYHYLKYREGKNSLSLHIPKDNLKELIENLEYRKKIEKEIRLYKDRIKYLEKILKVGKG